ncbi:MAG: radical SAM protein [Calditrichaeota bacterium]|nr:MAG: radical SAM protein [Calditrichota bacterium]
MKILLVSTYELGHPPVGLASPAACLRREGHQVTCADCAVEDFPEAAAASADLVGFYLPMHTATRLALPLLRRTRQRNPRAHICAYGLYAPLNAGLLRREGVDTVIGGEFEEPLAALCRRLSGDGGNGRKAAASPFPSLMVNLSKQRFPIPDRRDMPPLSRYAKLCCRGNTPKLVGYVEATRGCKHTCRHCPIVPVYGGRFRVIQREVVLADIRQQVEAGAQHITFGDPDFFNGPGHGLAIVREMHREFPRLTYDVTIKIEHLLRHRRHLPELNQTGCVLITSAVESIDDEVLARLQKGHTRRDFLRTLRLLDREGLVLNPTFIPFTPWTTPESYRRLLRLLAEWDLVEQVAPIQLAIRLLIPRGSLLLELPEIGNLVGEFDEEGLCYPWRHPLPEMDALQRRVMDIVRKGEAAGLSRSAIMGEIWKCAGEISGKTEPLPEPRYRRSRAEIPYLNEPWYC